MSEYNNEKEVLEILGLIELHYITKEDKHEAISRMLKGIYLDGMKAGVEKGKEIFNKVMKNI